jgi:hypothetical protein
LAKGFLALEELACFLRRFLRPTHKGFFTSLEELACFWRRFRRPTRASSLPLRNFLVVRGA